MLPPPPGVQSVDCVDHRLLRAYRVGISLPSLRRQQLRPALFHQPANRRVGQRSTDGGGCRQSMQNVAHGAQPHNQDFGHSRLPSNSFFGRSFFSRSFLSRSFLSRSVVEWSFGSPTIATRPPQAITTSRSGTLSAV